MCLQLGFLWFLILPIHHSIGQKRGKKKKKKKGMVLIRAVLSNLLSNLTCSLNYDALPVSTLFKKRKQEFAIMDSIERKKLKEDAINLDMLVALPPELREIIIQKLDLVDYHRVSAVSKSWRSIAIAAKESHCFSLRQLPWLLLSSDKDAHHGFFSLCHGKIFKLKLPEICGARCCGSSLGWLIMADEVGGNFLLHPFSRHRIQLPCQTTLYPFNPYDGFELWRQDPLYIRKAMLLSPSTVTGMASNASCTEVVANCVVVVLFASNCLGSCRPGDLTWTDLSEHIPIAVEDVIYYNGQLYAIDVDYDLVLIELGPCPRGTRLNLLCPAGYDRKYRRGAFIYLVESCGELLMVLRPWYFLSDGRTRLRHIPPVIATTFDVFKLDFKGRCWIKVESLGDQMLFVGTSSGVSLSASNLSGFKENCIYFTDDNFSVFGPMVDSAEACCDVGVFSLEDGSIKSFFPTDSHSSRCPPIWFIPSQL
ncbi:hypothetical protein L1049_009029 [Liquidambar formosana]|uniref:F-box domain-containing protein n=1 Tax=Liquidambar formosana TaxID=63359 RepID=A0AAP0SAR6_LIQFO